MLENVYLSANWLSVSSNCIPFTSTFEKFSSALSDASQHRKDKKTTIVFKSSLTLFNPDRHLFLYPTMWNLSAVSGLRYPLWKVPLVVYFIVHASELWSLSSQIFASFLSTSTLRFCNNHKKLITSWAIYAFSCLALDFPS